VKNNNYAGYLELVRLDPLSTVDDINKACEFSIGHGLAALSVPPLFVKKAKEKLGDSPVKLSTVAGYPIGFNAVESKLAEIVLAILDGADEIVLTTNLTALKNNDWQYLASELNAILPVARSKSKNILISIQGDKLTGDELAKCCDLYGIAGVNMIELNSMGISHTQLSECISQARSMLTDAVGLKINAFTDSDETVKSILDMGVSRIGTPDLGYLALS